MNASEQLNHAIAAHGMWKARLRQAVETGQSEWTPEMVQPDDRCEFGRWLGSLKPPESTSDRCVTIRRLHAEFHKEAARILTLAISGKKSEAEDRLEPGGHFTQTSADLTLAMVDWKEALRAH